MPVKIVLVISEGPMGSSVVAGLVETFGFLQLPFREYGLIDHAIQLKDRNRSFFRALRSRSEDVTESINQGLRVAEDRARLEPFRRFDSGVLKDQLERVQSDVDRLGIQELYDQSRRAVAKSLTYKTAPDNPQGHVELITVIGDSVDKERLQKLKQVFPELRVIYMTRDFVDWCESLASLRFLHIGKWKNFLFSDLTGRYSRYSATVASLENDALEVKFEEVFQPHTPELVQKLCDFLGEEKTSTEGMAQDTLDLFGQPIPFLEATTLGDTPGRYFSGFSRTMIRVLAPPGDPSEWLKSRVPKWKSIIVYLFYFVEFARYHTLRKFRGN